MYPWLLYQIARFLFKTGIAGWHPNIHRYVMGLFQRSADQEFEPAQLFFGQLLKYKGVSSLNRVAGITYLRRSALHGSMQAQFMLAEALRDQSLVSSIVIDATNGAQSEPVSESPLSLYTAAAEAGHKMAALRLCQIYREGLLGVEPDAGLAKQYFDQFSRDGQLPHDG